MAPTQVITIVSRGGYVNYAGYVRTYPMSTVINTAHTVRAMVDSLYANYGLYISPYPARYVSLRPITRAPSS